MDEATWTIYRHFPRIYVEKSLFMFSYDESHFTVDRKKVLHHNPVYVE